MYISSHSLVAYDVRPLIVQDINAAASNVAAAITSMGHRLRPPFSGTTCAMEYPQYVTSVNDIDNIGRRSTHLSGLWCQLFSAVDIVAPLEIVKRLVPAGANGS
jgi:hypothetical protein